MKKKILIIILSVLAITIGYFSIVLLKNKDNYLGNKKCIIQFESNGGTNIETQEIKCGELVSKPDNPQKEGFIFKTWFYNGEEYDFSAPVLHDLLLEANYEANDDTIIVIVSFDTSGGSKINDIEVKKGLTITKPVEPTMSGYKFIGWYKDYKEFDFNTPIDENIILKAKWEEKSAANENIQMATSSNKYKCSSSFRSDVPVKNVTVGYSDHVNWTWTTNGSGWAGDANTCYVTYKTSDSKIATVSDEGIIATKKAGTVYIWECVNDTETKTEVICFKGQLNIMDANDTTTVTSKYDTIANKYAGVWYLEGYADVYITVSKYKMYYEAMDIMPMNVDVYDGKLYPSSYGGIQISYENWNADIKKYNVTLGNNYISIKNPSATYKFTKTKGTKTKYHNSQFYEVLGTWYLYNNPESYVKIYKEGDDTDPAQTAFYCIDSYKLDVSTLKQDSWGGYGCDEGTSNALLKKYNISVSNGEMTISNQNDSVKLYKTKKTVPVSSVSLSKAQLNLNMGESEKITATVTPSNAYNQNLTWSSSDSSVATVVDGLIEGINEGNAVITVTTDDGNKTAKCTVNVKKIYVESITISSKELNLIKNQTHTLTANIIPSNATNPAYSWSSSNPEVVTVDSSGIVTAISKGMSTITATTADGNKQAMCIVNVTNPPLTANGSIGISMIFSGNSAYRGISVDVTASGGTGVYNYYYIKLYKNGTLISQTTNTSKNSIFAVGHSNGSYYAEIEVHDSDGTVYTGTASSTISGF